MLDNDIDNVEVPVQDAPVSDPVAPVQTEPIGDQPTEPQQTGEPVQTSVDDAQAASTEPVYEIVYKGQPMTLTLEELKTRAQMGEDYTQKTQSIAEERKAYERLTGILNQNPELAGMIQRAVAGQPIMPPAAQQPQTTAPLKVNYDDYVPEVAALFHKVDQLEQENAGFKNFLGNIQQAQAVSQIQGTITSVRDHHKAMTGRDFMPDEEAMLANYVQENGFNITNPEHVKAAYNLVFQGNIQTKAQQAAAARIAEDHRNGVVARTPVAAGVGRPQAAPAPATDYKGMDADDVAARILAQYNTG